MSQVRPGALIAIIIFAVFAAYAFLAPATYRTSALLLVDSASSATPAGMPEPIEAARRLGEAILDRKTLERLSRERAGTAGVDAQPQAASDVRHSLEIDTSDGHAFSISYRDTNAARTQSACNELARHAVELAPKILIDRSAEQALDLKRQQQTQELAAFLALHPQVAAEAPPSGSTSPDNDPALSAFHAEKANLEHRILEIESGVVSDNPYVDPRESDLNLLRRRLVEIDSAVTARRQAFDAKPESSTLSPDIRAEWKRLLEAVSQTSAEDTKPHASLVARLATVAPLPSGPIEPNRQLLLFFGLVFGVGLGAAYTLAIRAAQQRRHSKSSRPPTPARLAPAQAGSARASVQSELNVQVPSAPALPSGLGPAVPMLQAPSNREPAIVPIPQRPISSSPPGPALVHPENGVSTSAPSSSRPPPRDFGAPPPADERSSDRPARRFASTLVLPPAENPVPDEIPTPDPVLASAAQAWDQQIRAHDVPGFAVVKAGSEPPPAFTSSSVPPPVPENKPISSAPPPAATIQRTTSRPPNQMKVTQPLGSFLPDAMWIEQSKAQGRSEQAHAQPLRTPLPARAPITSRPPGSGGSSASTSQSGYSYVSNPPAGAHASRSSSSPPSERMNVIHVQEVPSGWRPDASLTPSAQRPLCEQLYPYAVENCFVIAVVGVPEAIGYKSRVAAELALGLAESGHPRILLLEGDLHRPLVQRLIGVDMPISTGFSQQLKARAQASSDSRWTVIGCTKSLHVLAEGMMRSPGLMLSTQFAECLKQLRSYYDFVVIDGPTASLDVDSGALNAVTDGIITVCPEKGSPALSHMQSLFSKKRFSAFATAR